MLMGSRLRPQTMDRVAQVRRLGPKELSTRTGPDRTCRRPRPSGLAAVRADRTRRPPKLSSHAARGPRRLRSLLAGKLWAPDLSLRLPKTHLRPAGARCRRVPGSAAPAAARARPAAMAPSAGRVAPVSLGAAPTAHYTVRRQARGPTPRSRSTGGARTMLCRSAAFTLRPRPAVPAVAHQSWEARTCGARPPLRTLWSCSSSGLSWRRRVGSARQTARLSRRAGPARPRRG